MIRSDSTVRIYLLGPFALEFKSRPINLATRPARLLLAYLALYRDRPLARERLADLFWGKHELDWNPDREHADSTGGSAGKRARASLRNALSKIRQSLGSDFFQEETESVQINPDREVWVDAVEFRNQVQALLSTPAPAPEMINLELYRGDLLVGFEDDPDEPWIAPEREALRDFYVSALLCLAQYLRPLGEYDKVQAYAQKVLELEPFNEEAHRHLMLCYFMQGNKSHALEQYRKLAQALHAEFGEGAQGEPAVESKELYNRIKTAKTQTVVPAAALTNLPNPLTRFIGREQELTRLENLLVQTDAAGTPRDAGAGPARLVTLVGPGGCGKTRLAIQLGTRLLDRYRDGVWWVELEALEREQGLVARAAAKALGVREQADRDLVDTLSDFLCAKKLLLILDNCEHVLPACVQLCDRLLQTCPTLQVLATSREAFRVAGGVDLTVQPFSFFAEKEIPSVEELGRFEAIRFFLDRAGVQRQGFALTRENAPSIAQICRRLDGIPLAIELATARMRTLSTEYIAEHLDDRFELLSKGPRAPARHQTLRAVVDWSYDLLAPLEQELFNNLGGFAGRFSFEAVEAIFPVQDNEYQLRDLLESLIDKSLVVMEIQATGEARYRLLDTIRQYAREKLQASPEEADAAFTRMSRYYLDFARQHEKDYSLLEQEWENLSAGLRSAHRQKRWEDVIEYGYALTPASFARGLYSEARSIYPWVCQAAEELEEQEAFIASMLKWSQAYVEQGFYPEAREILERLLRICREAYDAGGIASAQFLLARIAIEESNFEEAQERLAESQRLRERMDDRAGLAETFYEQASIRFRLYDDEQTIALAKKALEIQESLPICQAYVTTLRLLSLAASYQNQHELAKEYGERVLTLCQELQDQAEYAVGLYNLSIISRQRGNLEMAHEYAEKSLALVRQIGDRKSQAHALTLLGRIALDLKDYQTAQQHALTSLSLQRELQDRQSIASVLLFLGDIAREMNDVELAKRRWAEALPIAESIKHPMAALIQNRLKQLD